MGAFAYCRCESPLNPPGAAEAVAGVLRCAACGHGNPYPHAMESFLMGLESRVEALETATEKPDPAEGL